MEVLPFMDYSYWRLGQSPAGGVWTREENKLFEEALARFDGSAPNRWQQVAAVVGKTVPDVVTHYRDLELDVRQIEAGLAPASGYGASSTLFWDDGGVGRRRPAPARARLPEQERKKVVLWTEEEHRLFLLGLNKHGKGDWRSISRNFVPSRTPTQVASHAQKYFLRLNSAIKDKKRPSIHDITTVTLAPEGRPEQLPSALAVAGHPSQSTGTVGGPYGSCTMADDRRGQV